MVAVVPITAAYAAIFPVAAAEVVFCKAVQTSSTLVTWSSAPPRTPWNHVDVVSEDVDHGNQAVATQAKEMILKMTHESTPDPVAWGVMC